VDPDFLLYKETGFAPPPDDPAKKGAQVLGVAITGGFDSFAAAQAKASPQESDAVGEADPLIEHSPPDARLVVIGSSSFVSDAVLELSGQLGMDLAQANITMVQNAVDWAVADTDLLSIRARSSGARALTVEEGERSKWEWINYGLAFAGLGAVVLLSWLRRRSVQPIELPEVVS
jgi:ABC-2 type transport system permease protein